MREGAAGLLLAAVAVLSAAAWPQAAHARNLLIFVADGLRADSVNSVDAPTLSALAARGVRFQNSHSVFPTFTTPNAASIATGEYPGQTGDFSNSLYIGYRLFNAGNYARRPEGNTPFLESDLVLGDLDDHYGGNFLGATSLLAAARVAGYSTAAIGKLGPAAIQDISQLDPQGSGFGVPQTIFIDDSTGSAAGIPLAPDVSAALAAAQLPLTAPARLQPAGNARVHGTVNANWSQQVYFVEAATRAVLPLLRARARPFVLLYWSRDPDGTQHNQGDSLNRLVPGINGRTSHEAVRDADEDLRQLLDALAADPRTAADTDVVVTSDHGFATISKQPIDAAGTPTRSPAALAHYADVPTGFLPPGFLALDLAAALDEPLYDPDAPVKDSRGNPAWRRILPGHHPRQGNGLIGGSGAALERTDADVLVTANGGSDLIYLPRPDAFLARRVVQILSGLDYVGALFTHDALGPIEGALPFSSAGLIGTARLPPPAIVVAFRHFVLPAAQTGIRDPLLNGVQISDTALQQGQGNHGSLGRDNTFNFMAAAGPDFRTRWRDEAPAGNADITPTLLAVLGLPWRPQGMLHGRVLAEALVGPHAGAAPGTERCLAMSAPLADGRRTLLFYQRAADSLYLDEADFRAARTRERAGCQQSRDGR
ncbi:MAG TPA: alkaline phosphatase family protein [Steroidobacteraceae bacterium]|nr:alkaline phosphatase family protein [Steroidobacteraceae bacterium]